MSCKCPLQLENSIANLIIKPYFFHSVRRERGDGFDKGGVTLVHMNQKHLCSKKMRRINLKTFVIVTKRKVSRQKNVQK
jgi:hypothetical protein